jgi:hypothetical protein
MDRVQGAVNNLCVSPPAIKYPGNILSGLEPEYSSTPQSQFQHRNRIFPQFGLGPILLAGHQ